MSLENRFRSHQGYARMLTERKNGIHGYMMQQGINNFQIKPLEILHFCKSRLQMRKMEQEWPKFWNPVFNIRESVYDFEVEENPVFLNHLIKCTCTIK